MATAALEVFANFVVVGGGIAGVSCAEQVSIGRYFMFASFDYITSSNGPVLQY